MATDGESWRTVEPVQEKVDELIAAVKELAKETQRLQVNLSKLHEFQASLLVVSQHWMEWIERTNKLHKKMQT